MFELNMTKRDLLSRLNLVSGAVDKRQSLAVLSNILFEVKDDKLTLTGTDLEIQISASFMCQHKGEGAITVPARKIMEIVRSLDDEIVFTLKFEEERGLLRASRSQFRLATLPAFDFPKSELLEAQAEFSLRRQAFIELLQSTFFAMSQQPDVRIFLNGLLLEFDSNTITAVATDGHRMAISKTLCDTGLSHFRLLLPRKSVLEMLRLLQSVVDENVQITIGKQGIRLSVEGYVLESKLLEARFPPYARVIPKDLDKWVLVETELLKRALSRISILANEKSKAVQLLLNQEGLTLAAHNQEQEEATETIEAEVHGETLKIGINGSYLLDVLNYFQEGSVRLSFSNTESSILAEMPGNDLYLYIIMPMKL